MPTTYHLSATDSDLTLGTDFTKELAEEIGTAGSVSPSSANGSQELHQAYTVLGHPGSNGASGTCTVKLNVTSQNTNYFIAVSASRVDAAGTVLSGGVLTAEQQANAGVLTFTPAIPAATWAAGNRLRLTIRVRNAQAMGGAGSITIATGDADSTIVAPWTLVLQHTRSATDLTGLLDDHIRVTESSRGPDEPLALLDEATYEHTPGSLPPIEVVVVRRVVGVLTDTG